VFSTSGRQPTIREQMRDRLHAYLGGITNGLARQRNFRKFLMAHAILP
jgi:hypothetical protein